MFSFYFFKRDRGIRGNKGFREAEGLERQRDKL